MSICAVGLMVYVAGLSAVCPKSERV